MGLRDFLDRMFKVEKYGGDPKTVVIDIPAELYYKELALYTATSMIGNAISRSEIKCYVKGKECKNKDYFLLNVSPNANETSSIFWHKIINKMVRKGKAIVVDAGGKLYCADDYAVEKKQPVLGDIYSNVRVGNLTFSKKFTQNDCYVFALDDANVKIMIDGMYEEYGKIMAVAAKSFKQTNGQKYKIHIDAVKAGDEEFEKEFNEIVSKQLKKYIEAENAVYPEFNGYTLEPDKKSSTPKTSEDFIKLRNDLFKMIAGAMHIPESMMTGNITNMQEVIGSFLSFGVDPYADVISESLNKRGGLENYIEGNYYLVDTGRINHRDLFNIAVGASNLVSNGVACIDEIREKLGWAPKNTEWSRKHFITKNYEEIERFLKGVEGGEKGET